MKKSIAILPFVLLALVPPKALGFSPDQNYLIEFDRVRVAAYGVSPFPPDEMIPIRLEQAKTYCLHLQAGKTEDAWIQKVLNSEEALKNKGSNLAAAELIKEETVMMTLAPQFYCPGFAP